VQMLTGFDELSLLQGKVKFSTTQRQTLRAVKPAVEKALPALPDTKPAPIAELAALEKAATTISAKYTPFEPTITNILKDLLESFKATAETEANNEADLQDSYERLMQTKTDQLTEKKEMVAKNEALKAEESQQLSDNELQWQATADAVTAANSLFAAAKEACSKKSDEWKERKAAREEELRGINAALETLTSDESRALINKAANDAPGNLDFLQVGSNNAEESRITHAYEALHGAAVKAKSVRLARIAKSLLRHQHRAPADKDAWKIPVVKAINKMIADLGVEQEEDTVTYDNCKEEQQKLQLEIENRTHIIKRHTIKLDQLSTKIEDLQKGIEEASQDVEDIVEMQAKMLAEREDENRQFEQEKQDDEGAVAILEHAIEDLSAFYPSQSTTPAALIQESDGDEVEDGEDDEEEEESLGERGSKQLRGFHGGSASSVGVHIGSAKMQTVAQKAKVAGNLTREGRLQQHVDKLAMHLGSQKSAKKDKAEKKTNTHKKKGLSWKSKKADPAFEVTNDDMLKQMGDHTFSDQQSRSGAAGGIVSLLNVIKEDLQSDIQKSIKLEREALAEYNKMKEESDTEKDDLKDKIDDYRSEKSAAEESTEDHKGQKENQESELASANKEMLMLMSSGDAGKDIHISCHFMISEYHNRRIRRDAEIEGLKEGISFLAGMR